MLVESVAKALDVHLGDAVSVTVARECGGRTENASLSLRLDAVVNGRHMAEARQTHDGTARTGGSATWDTRMSRRSARWNSTRWGIKCGGSLAGPQSVRPDRYASYLIFCEHSNPLTEEDLRTFEERGYSIHRVEEEDLRTLCGLLTPDSLMQLLVYRLRVQGNEDRLDFSMAPGQVARWTAADDIVIPWNEPKTVSIEGRPTRVVGCPSLSQRGSAST